MYKPTAQHAYTDDCLCFRCSMIRVGLTEKEVEERIRPEESINIIYADFRKKSYSFLSLNV